AGIARSKHDQFILDAPWSDLKAWDFLAHHLPVPIVLHLGNSASIRYSLLFEMKEGIDCYSNLCVSGIDGCTSTALGFATQEVDNLMWLITGVISSLFDRNALWQTTRPFLFKVVVIDNGGGCIFRFIEGFQNTEIFDPFLE